MRLCLMSFVLVVLGGLTWATAAEPGLRAGAYAQDITPAKLPISSNGNMADRIATRVHDALHARCLVLQQGEVKVALVTCDSCMIPREIIDQARAEAERRTGILASNILVSATHSHSCPSSAGVFQSDPDADYVAFLPQAIAEGIEKAAQQLVPAKAGWGSAIEGNVLFNRRWQLKPEVLGENPFGKKVDRVRMNPGYRSPQVVAPAGAVDPEVVVLAVKTVDGKPLALWANYSLHYVGGVGGEDLSADYFGEFCARVPRNLGLGKDVPFVAALTNGTSGDVNNINFAMTNGPKRDPYEQIQVVAEVVAQAATHAWSRADGSEGVVLKSVDREIELGVRLPSAEDVAEAQALLAAAKGRALQGMREIYARETVLMAAYPPKVKARIQAIRVGELGIVSSPCETFTETGLAIKAGSPLAKSCTIELANGYNGYLPTAEQHELGGYETWRARSSYLATDAESMIRKVQLELLQQVARD